MNTPAPDGRWFCERCLARYAGPGDCLAASCDEEPLLDLADADVQLMLENADQARGRTRLSQVSVVGLAVATPLMLLGVGMVGKLGAIPGFFVGAAIIAGLMRAFPAQVRSPEDLDELTARVEAERRARHAREGKLPLGRKPRPPAPTGPTEPCSHCGQPTPKASAHIGEHGIVCARCQGVQDIDDLEARARDEHPHPLELLL